MQEEVGKGWNLILQGEDLNGTYKLWSYFSIPWPQSGIFQNKWFEPSSLWLQVFAIGIQIDNYDYTMVRIANSFPFLSAL